LSVETLYRWDARKFLKGLSSPADEGLGGSAQKYVVINILKKGGLWIVPTSG
jgi:hypothetical protein